jgi:hypothetical protein
MNRLGKNLVLLNTALSFMFVAWSVGLYTQQVPWENDIKNELAPEIKGLVEARDRADARWHTAYKKVTLLEKEIPDRSKYYVSQLKLANTGLDSAGNKVEPPVSAPEVVNGLVVMKTQGRAAYQIDGKPALSFAGYKSAIEKQLDETRDTKQKINKVTADTTVLTTEVNGTKPATEAITRVEKGLRGQLTDAITLKKNAQLEQEFLQSPLTNDKVELELLKRRQLALEARLKELAVTVIDR